MVKRLWGILAILSLVGLAACGADNQEPVAQNPEQATAQAIVSEMQSVSATAEASTTSTTFLDYEAQITAARKKWRDSNITNYYWKYNHVNPASIGQQTFEVTVENGRITTFNHSCSPEKCTLLRVDNQTDFTPEGVFDQLLTLAAQQHAMAVLRFDADTGLPQAIAADSDEAPYYIQWGTDEFEVIE